MKTTTTILPAAVILNLTSLCLADPAPAGHSAPPASVSTQYLMENNGGSLLQASLPQSPDNNPNVPSYNLYAVPEPVPRVLKKHDLVNIIVREESTSESKGTTDLKKNADFDAKVDSFVKLNLAAASIMGQTLKNPPEIKMEANRDFKGDASVDRTDSVVLRLEAEVIDVKPNGTLVIQAHKHIKSDEEEQNVTLTGICRVDDVDASNSVLSTDLHDLDLQKTTTGAVRNTTKRGLIPRLLDFINPF